MQVLSVTRLGSKLGVARSPCAPIAAPARLTRLRPVWFKEGDVPEQAAAREPTRVPPQRKDIVPGPTQTGIPGILPDVPTPPHLTAPGVPPPATNTAPFQGVNRPLMPDLPAAGAPIDMPGPYPMPAYLGVHLNPLVRLGLGVLAAGWVAVAGAALITPASTTQLMFPTAVNQAGSSLLVALWGASLIPLGFATQALKGAADCNMAGTPAANQLTAAVFIGCLLTLMVTLQAVSLRSSALTNAIGGLSIAGLGLTTWIATQVHPWKLPLPSFTGVMSSLLSLVRPSSWASALYSAISIALLVTGTWLFRTVPGAPNVFLGGQQPAASLAVFISRAIGAAFLSQGVMCVMLKEATDKKLLAAPTACRLSGALALSALFISTLLSSALVSGTAMGSRPLWTVLLGQLGVFAWAAAAYLKPTQLELSALPPNASAVLGSAVQLEHAHEFTPTQFYAAMTTRPQPWDV